MHVAVSELQDKFVKQDSWNAKKDEEIKELRSELSAVQKKLKMKKKKG